MHDRHFRWWTHRSEPAGLSQFLWSWFWSSTRNRLSSGIEHCFCTVRDSILAVDVCRIALLIAPDAAKENVHDGGMLLRRRATEKMIREHGSVHEVA